MNTNLTKYISPFAQFLGINLRFYLVLYLWIGGGLILVLSIMAYFLSVSQPQLVGDFLKGAFWFFVNTGGLIVTTSAFSMYSKKQNRIHLLMVPVSSVQRFATVLLYSIPVYLVFMLFFYTLVARGISLVFTVLNYTKPFTFSPFRVEGPTCTSSFAQHLFVFLMLQSAFLLIGSFFLRLGFLKSLGVILCLILLYAFINALFTSSEADGNFPVSFFALLMSDDHPEQLLKEQMPVIAFLWKSIGVLLIPFCWYTGYLQVREMEV